MRATALVLAVALATAALAARAGAAYSVDPGAALDGGMLKVAPQVSGPPGARLRYEIEVRREGPGNSSDNRQSGTVVLDGAGKARLATSAVSVQAGQSFSVNVKIFEGERLAAERSMKGP